MAVRIGEGQELSQQGWDGWRYKGAAFQAGLVAGMSMTGVMLVLLLTGITPRSLANLVSDKIAATAGAGIQEFFIQNVGSLGKQLLFLAVLIGQAIVGGLLGLLFAAVSGRVTQPSRIWRNSFGLSIGLWLIFVVLGFPLLDSGFLGSGLENDQVSTLVISFLLFQLFGLVFGYAYMFLVPNEAALAATAQEEEQELAEARKAQMTSRRRFVTGLSALFVLLVGAAIGTKAFGPTLSTYRATLGDLRPDGTLEGEVTPTASFYQVSKNTFNPKVDGTSWRMEINGLVTKPLTFDLATLKQMPQQTLYHTLTCISNPVGGEYIGNAQWKGIPLHSLLEMAGVGKNVQRVVFTSADGYKDSITIAKALEPNTFLALEMNGAALTDDHGYPARMLIPDIYGMKNAKWLTAITLLDTDFLGFWQKQGWDNLATIRTQASIVSPPDIGSVKAGEPTVIKGIAYAGSRQIEKVEVSTDNGQTWLAASLKTPLGPNAWTLWRLEWTPPANSSKVFFLKVRAYETGHQVQDPDQQEPFPSGASGYHTISVQSTV